MATHLSTLAWEGPRTEDPLELWNVGSGSRKSEDRDGRVLPAQEEFNRSVPGPAFSDKGRLDPGGGTRKLFGVRAGHEGKEATPQAMVTSGQGDPLQSQRL